MMREVWKNNKFSHLNLWHLLYSDSVLCLKFVKLTKYSFTYFLVFIYLFRCQVWATKICVEWADQSYWRWLIDHTICVLQKHESLDNQLCSAYAYQFNTAILRYHKYMVCFLTKNILIILVKIYITFTGQFIIVNTLILLWKVQWKYRVTSLQWNEPFTYWFGWWKYISNGFTFSSSRIDLVLKWGISKITNLYTHARVFPLYDKGR